MNFPEHFDRYDIQCTAEFWAMGIYMDYISHINPPADLWGFMVKALIPGGRSVKISILDIIHPNKSS